jgi:hypothetical protein
MVTNCSCSTQDNPPPCATVRLGSSDSIRRDKTSFMTCSLFFIVRHLHLFFNSIVPGVFVKGEIHAGE